jgi:hypothetical protein
VPDGKHAPDDAQTRECAGILILVKREYRTYVNFVSRTGLPGGEGIQIGFDNYRRARPFGLTRMGILVMAQRTGFADVPLIGGKRMPEQEIDTPEIGYPPLGAWPP